MLREVKRKKGRNIDIWSKKEETIYSIRATFRDGYHFDILVNRFGKVMIDERRIDRNEDWYNDDGYDRNDDRKDRDNSYDNGGDRDDRIMEDDRDDRDNRDYDDDRDDK